MAKVSRVFQGSFMSVLRYFNELSKKFKGCYIEVDTGVTKSGHPVSLKEERFDISGLGL